MKYALMILAALLFFGFGIYIAVQNYGECREHGFSIVYCITRK